MIRIDLRRSLLMHRRLALFTTLAAAALGAILLYLSRPDDAVYPGVILKVCLFLLVAAGCGIVAAIAAHNLDSRIYLAADVEHFLGVPTVADLPDFGEASEEESEGSLVKLARGIAEMCSPGSVKRCVLTGAGKGAGVSTLATRLKEALESLDRPAMIVDATDTPATGTGGDGAAHFVVPPGAADESGSQRDELILTDTSPLTSSPDTEFLVRFADYVVVVIESGVMTRMQLEPVVERLQQRNAATVKFVVNRVKRAQSGQGLRQSVFEQVASMHYEAAIRRAIADPPMPSISPEVPTDVPVPADESVEPIVKPTTALAIVKRSQGIEDWTAPGIPPWLSEALRKLDAEAECRSEVREETRATSEDDLPAEATAPIADGAEREQGPVTFERRSNGNAALRDDTGAMLFAMDLKPSQSADTQASEFHEPALSATDAGHENRPSRLNGLRGIVSAAELKGLKPAWHREAGIAPGALSNQKVDRAVIAKNVEAAALPVEQGQSDLAAQKPAPASAVAAVTQVEDPGETVTAEAQLRQSKPPVSVRPERSANEEVQILPSKRGQYRRKKQ